VQKVIVIGKDGVTGEASVGTNPTIVITDDSCADAAACEKRAKDELSKQNKLHHSRLMLILTCSTQRRLNLVVTLL